MLRVACDCAGIDAPIESLRNLNIPFDYIFSSEIDNKLRENIIRTNKPKLMFPDMSKRDHSKLPETDLYISGIPCQSHSSLGSNQQLNCINGNLLYDAIETIKYSNPKYFIIENVKQLLKCDIVPLFNQLDYNVYYEMINSKFFTPQHRERLYIIGIHNSLHKNFYNFQSYNKSIKSIDTILDNYKVNNSILPPNQLYLLNEVKMKKKILDRENYVINLGCSSINYASCSFNISPTLITTCYGYYLTKYNRYLSINELKKLQGIQNVNLNFLCKTSQYKAIGNSFTVDVISHIISILLD